MSYTVRTDNGLISDEEFEEKMLDRDMNTLGQEMPDPTVMEPPVGFVANQDIWDTMYAMIRRAAAEKSGGEEFDTEEEAGDFDTGDEDGDTPETPYEERFWKAVDDQVEVELERRGLDRTGVPKRQPQAAAAPAAATAAPVTTPAGGSTPPKAPAEPGPEGQG